MAVTPLPLPCRRGDILLKARRYPLSRMEQRPAPPSVSHVAAGEAMSSDDHVTANPEDLPPAQCSGGRVQAEPGIPLSST
jgi:hypothetical protein